MKNSGIEWTDHTVNPWWGCEKIAPECKNCYAADVSRHYKGPEWGKTTPRKERVDAALRELAKYAKLGAKLGTPQRVFIASMADIFEDRADVAEWRLDFLRRAQGIPGAAEWLRLLLLSKRTEVMLDFARTHGWADWWWAGATAGHPTTAARTVPLLLQVPAKVRFLSCEPLLGSVAIPPALLHPIEGTSQHGQRFIDWVIAGGESGPRARPMHPDWARSLRDQAVGAGVPFFFKQWGEWAPIEDHSLNGTRIVRLDAGTFMARVGKKAAGKTLDGREWMEVPHV